MKNSHFGLLATAIGLFLMSSWLVGCADKKDKNKNAPHTPQGLEVALRECFNRAISQTADPRIRDEMIMACEYDCLAQANLPPLRLYDVNLANIHADIRNYIAYELQEEMRYSNRGGIDAIAPRIQRAVTCLSSVSVTYPRGTGYRW